MPILLSKTYCRIYISSVYRPNLARKLKLGFELFVNKEYEIDINVKLPIMPINWRNNRKTKIFIHTMASACKIPDGIVCP